MDEDMDLDDLLELWKSELEEDAARMDIMPSSRPPPIQNARTLAISRKNMLFDVARGLSASDPVYDTWFRYGGYYSNVQLSVPDPVISGELHEESSSSIHEFSTQLLAEEKAAEVMIRKLERNYDFETRDLNWWHKRLFDLNRYNCGSGWREAKEEIAVLKSKVESLIKGWRRTLERVDRSCDVISSACSIALGHAISDPADAPATPVVSVVEDAEEAVSRALFEGIREFEDVAEKY